MQVGTLGNFRISALNSQAMNLRKNYRAFLLAGALALCAAPVWPQRSAPARVYFGTYTTKSTSHGIYTADWNAARSEIAHLEAAGASEDPSFLALATNGKFLYAVNERNPFGDGTPGEVSAFSVDPATGQLILLNKVSSEGGAPCFVSLDRSGKFVFVANYDTGTIVVFPVLPDGRLGPPATVIQDRDTGSAQAHREGPHAHWIAASPDNRFVLVCDLGLDKVFIFRFDAQHGTLTPNPLQPFAEVAPGSGPRHAVFSRDAKFLYVNSETASLVTVFAYDAARGTLRQRQTIRTVPDGLPGHNDTAEIALAASGKFLYVSNRGYDSIAIFSVSARDGRLRRVTNVATGGKEPRNFALDPSGTKLVAANQNSDTLTIFRLDPRTGIPAPAGESMKLPSPVCVIFAASHSSAADFVLVQNDW